MESAGGNRLYRIDPLKGPEHYPVWKIKMMDILTDSGLWEYVTGSKPRPADDAAGLPDWRKKDRSALSTIRLRIADANLVYVSGAETSKEAWDGLKNVFEPHGPIAIVMVRRKLFRAQCEEGGNVEEHIRTLRGYQEELNILSPKNKITEEDFSITLLTSLPDSWNPFIASIDSTQLANSNTLIAQILEEDRRLHSKNDTTLASQERRKGQKKKYNPNVTCYNCGKKGHIKPDCRSPKKELPGGKPNQ